ncbi:MAG: transglutaminase domain-containing protein [Oscillospiraceae bacterium]|jgi:hypothetical protein|nr:transglutaminase domain-containing protein [Oscillospiraceae bacterium]
MTEKEAFETEQRVFDIYSGILINNQEFAGSGETAEITYDFDCPEYKTLIEKYGIDKIAGEGTAFQRGVRLMHWMAPKLTHKSNYDSHIPVNALDLLDYSLGRPERGINCLNKSKILAECCLAVGIYARRVSILPYSPYDGDNHVVTEIFDEDMGKWVMLDPTTDGFFVDEEGGILSVLELREKFARQDFATFAVCTEDLSDLRKLRDRHMEDNAYYCKNLFRLLVDGYNGFGGGKLDLKFIPVGYDLKRNMIANAEYRIRKFPGCEESARKWIAKIEAEPDPVPAEPALLAAPPK